MLVSFLPFPYPDVVVEIVRGRRLRLHLLLHLEVRHSSRKSETLSELVPPPNCVCERGYVERSLS